MPLNTVLEEIANLTIHGWYDFQIINDEIWGFTNQDFMPRKVPDEIAIEYQEALQQAQQAIKNLRYQEHQAEIAARRSELEARVHQLETRALPAGCYVCPYKVRRQQWEYEYMKLWHHEAIFASRGTLKQREYWIKQGKTNLEVGKVRNVHLGKAGSVKHEQAIEGIKARQELERVKRQLSILKFSG